jgi:hypothetical protein
LSSFDRLRTGFPFEREESAKEGSVARFALLRRSPLCFATDRGAEGSMMDFKGSQFEEDPILWGIRWYIAYPISIGS